MDKGFRNYEARLAEMQAQLTRKVNDVEEALREDVVAPGDISTVPTHPADFDAEGMDVDIAIAANEEHLLEAVEAALDRIADGTFGKCQDCGRPIDKKRLDAIPYTPWCIDCATRHEKSEA